MADNKRLYGDRLEEQIWIHRCLECRGQVKQLGDPEIQDGPLRGAFHKRRSHTIHRKIWKSSCASLERPVSAITVTKGRRNYPVNLVLIAGRWWWRCDGSWRSHIIKNDVMAVTRMERDVLCNELCCRNEYGICGPNRCFSSQMCRRKSTEKRSSSVHIQQARK